MIGSGVRNTWHACSVLAAVSYAQDRDNLGEGCPNSEEGGLILASGLRKWQVASGAPLWFRLPTSTPLGAIWILDAF